MWHSEQYSLQKTLGIHSTFSQLLWPEGRSTLNKVKRGVIQTICLITVSKMDYAELNSSLEYDHLIGYLSPLGVNKDGGSYRKWFQFLFLYHIWDLFGVEWFFSLMSREKGKDLTQSYDKSPHTTKKIQKAKWQHKNANKNFNYTTITERLMTVSWSNDSQPADVVTSVSGIPTFQFTTKAVLSKGHIFTKKNK